MIRINTSISAVQAPVLLALNEMPDVTPEQRQHFRNVFQHVLASGADFDSSTFTESIQREIGERFRADWQVVADSLTSFDPDEAQVFQTKSARWLEPIVPFGGGSLDDPFVQQETLRLLQLLALRYDLKRPSLLGRLYVKLRDDPAGAPHALFRGVRRLG